VSPAQGDVGLAGRIGQRAGQLLERLEVVSLRLACALQVEHALARAEQAVPLCQVVLSGQVERPAQVGHRLGVGELGCGLLARTVKVGDRLPRIPCTLPVVGQGAELFLYPLGIEPFQCFRGLPVIGAALSPQQAGVGRLVGQVVLEGILALWQARPLADQLCALEEEELSVEILHL